MNWIEQKNEGTVVQVRVVPRSKVERVDGLLGDALKIRLQAPPVEGKANKALLKFLSKQTGLPISRIELLSGETNRNKRIFFSGVSRNDVEKTLLKE